MVLQRLPKAPPRPSKAPPRPSKAPPRPRKGFPKTPQGSFFEIDLAIRDFVKIVLSSRRYATFRGWTGSKNDPKTFRTSPFRRVVAKCLPGLAQRPSGCPKRVQKVLPRPPRRSPRAPKGSPRGLLKTILELRDDSWSALGLSRGPLGSLLEQSWVPRRSGGSILLNFCVSKASQITPRFIQVSTKALPLRNFFGYLFGFPLRFLLLLLLLLFLFC